MKQNYTINALLLIFCVLLLGFVYVNSLVMDDYDAIRQEESQVIEHPVDIDTEAIELTNNVDLQ